MPSLTFEGKPTITLHDNPKEEKTKCFRYCRNEAEEQEMSGFIDCLYRIVETNNISPTDAELLVATFRSKRSVCWGNSGKRLMQFSHYFRQAADILLALIVDKDAVIRLRVVQSIWSEVPPRDLMCRLLETGLRDRGAKVRQFSAVRVQMNEIAELVPTIESLLQQEVNPKTHDSMSMCVSILKKGYWLKPLPDGRFSVTIQAGNLMWFEKIDAEQATDEQIRKLIDKGKRLNRIID